MEVARSVLSPTPSIPPPPLWQSPRTHLRTTPSSLKVASTHDQSNQHVTSMMRHISAAFHQGNYDKMSTSTREEKVAEIGLDRRKINCAAMLSEEKNRFPTQSASRDSLPHFKEKLQSTRHMEYRSNNGDYSTSVVSPSDVVLLAQEAMLASQEAANLPGSCGYLQLNIDKTHFPSLEESVSEGKQITRSGQFLRRKLKKRRVLKKKKDAPSYVHSTSIYVDSRKDENRSLKSNDILDIFLQHPDTRHLLTLEQEKDLFARVQDLLKIEEVERRLHTEFDREPTIFELAKAVGISSHSLHLRITDGNRSREKMFHANLRLVAHLAKRYQGQGPNLEELLQAGSMGLMKSFAKFNQNSGCRFGSYAYWWIKCSIKEALFQYPRTFRLPVRMHILLRKIKREIRALIRGGQNPTKRDLAERVGIKVEKLERLLLVSRTPISLQRQVFPDQKFTFLDILEDPNIESPDLSFERKMMRQNVGSLLQVLPVTERQVICSRYGIPSGEVKTIAETAHLCGLSLEGVRRAERRALDMLRGCIDSHGLTAYISLTV